MSAGTAERRRATAPIRFGYRWIGLPGPVRARVPVRSLVVGAVILVLLLACLALALMLGERFVPLPDVVAAPQGHARKIIELYVVTWRLPRALAAIAVGAVLGASGAIFQTLTRNPLGSPDIIGFTTGAHTGGLLVILVAGTTAFYPVAGGALLGGLATAVIVVPLARRGQAQGFRLIIMGIGLTAMLASIDTYLVLTADLDSALAAASWGVGSLAGSTWPYVTPMPLCAAVALALCVPLSRPLAQLDLGDDLGSALGATPGRTRPLGNGIGVLLVAVATTIAGPVTFVALAAPQIGRRLVRAQGTPMLPAIGVGALGTLAADLVAQHAFATELQLGVVTVALGGLYLTYLVALENRKGRL